MGAVWCSNSNNVEIYKTFIRIKLTNQKTECWFDSEIVKMFICVNNNHFMSSTFIIFQLRKCTDRKKDFFYFQYKERCFLYGYLLGQVHIHILHTDTQVSLPVATPVGCISTILRKNRKVHFGYFQRLKRFLFLTFSF